MRRILGFILLLSHFSLSAMQINTYLKFDSPQLTDQVRQFNTYLEKQGVFARYHVKPFLEQHPLHITLYMTEYPADQIEAIRQRVAELARENPAPTMKTGSIVLGGGNYVMLDIAHQPEKAGNSALQNLSDHLVLQLQPLRDLNASMPSWAANMPVKAKAFRIYGSPSVFFEYEPHFSLIAKKFSNNQEEKRFRLEMEKWIQSYSFPAIPLQATAIAIGKVNSFGQITEELASYPFAASSLFARGLSPKTPGQA